MKFYITFGQIHTHSVNGKTFDKNSVAQIEAKSEAEARTMANNYFKGIYHNLTKEIPDMEFYPRGIIEV